MTLKKQARPKRWRDKASRELARAIRAAGGDVERTSRGHMRVTGPAGSIVVTPDTGSSRTTANTRAQIRRDTGLDLTGK
jgi:hypothetical protein